MEPATFFVDKGIDPYKKPFQDKREDEKVQELPGCISAIWHTFFYLCMPCTCCCVITKVKPMHDTIVTRCGIVHEILRDPGPYLTGCCIETQDVFGTSNY